MPIEEEKSSAKVAHSAAMAESVGLNPIIPLPNTKHTAKHAKVPLHDLAPSSASSNLGPPIVVPTIAATGSPIDRHNTDNRATFIGNARLAAVPNTK